MINLNSNGNGGQAETDPEGTRGLAKTIPVEEQREDGGHTIPNRN